MSDILSTIIASKHQEVRAAKQAVTLENLKLTIANIQPTRGFAEAILSRVARSKTAVIAEIKKASPSKGVIREPFVPADIAISYELAGAACLSVLTDEQYFQGCVAYLQQAKSASRLPVLRKDFIIDEYQIYESRAMGADAILLIAAALTQEQMQTYEQIAHNLGLDVLVEVHNAQELAIAAQLKTPLLGINNRNLKTFEVNLQNTIDLLAYIPAHKCVITESGIVTRQNIALMEQNKVHAFLIGETFMRALDPGKAMEELFSQAL